ncbi:MAG: hypothetical protein HY360_22060, partial [Verrucomicrobia bacterium]|nr:hypothetical protein [Verrucomicrobiota bacterium]
RVVKNVAGYDLCKLFVGARGSLGVILEATFKLRPLPEAEKFVQAHFDTLEKAGAFLSGVWRSEVAPVALDLHHQVSGGLEPPSAFTVVAGFAGMKEDVAWQISRIRDLGAGDSSSLEYERRFWNAPLALVRRLSAIPSKIVGSLAGLQESPFVARAGNGVIYYRGGPEPPKTKPSGQLARRIKDAYDPKHILSDIPI